MRRAVIPRHASDTPFPRGHPYNLAPNGLHFFVRNKKARGGAKRAPSSLVSSERVRAMSIKQGKQHNGLGSRGHDSVRLIGLVRAQSDVSSERSAWAAPTEWALRMSQNWEMHYNQFAL